jgi:hypothetical protein
VWYFVFIVFVQIRISISDTFTNHDISYYHVSLDTCSMWLLMYFWTNTYVVDWQFYNHKYIFVVKKLNHVISYVLMKQKSIWLQWMYLLATYIQITCAKKGQLLFCKIPLRFYQKVLWNWYHQHARGFDWQHICFLWWACFSTDSRHTYGYKLCSSFRRLVPLFVWGRLHIGASQEKRKETSSILKFHVPLYRWCPFTK